MAQERLVAWKEEGVQARAGRQRLEKFSKERVRGESERARAIACILTSLNPRPTRLLQKMDRLAVLQKRKKEIIGGGGSEGH